jgi:hypothetical protein
MKTQTPQPAIKTGTAIKWKILSDLNPTIEVEHHSRPRSQICVKCRNTIVETEAKLDIVSTLAKTPGSNYEDDMRLRLAAHSGHGSNLLLFATAGGDLARISKQTGVRFLITSTCASGSDTAVSFSHARSDTATFY